MVVWKSHHHLKCVSHSCRVQFVPSVFLNLLCLITLFILFTSCFTRMVSFLLSLSCSFTPFSFEKLLHLHLNIIYYIIMVCHVCSFLWIISCLFLRSFCVFCVSVCGNTSYRKYEQEEVDTQMFTLERLQDRSSGNAGSNWKWREFDIFKRMTRVWYEK